MNQIIKTDKKTRDRLDAALAKRNAKFKKMTLGEQRCAIAQDVINMLRTKKINAVSTYFDLPQSVQVDGEEVNTESDEVQNLQVHHVAAQVQCEVCGIGSLFLSAVNTCNKFKFSKFDGHTRRAEVDYLRKWFGGDQLYQVENYYEQHENRQDSPILACIASNRRLKMIMENIISNKGQFDPFKGRHKIRVPK